MSDGTQIGNLYLLGSAGMMDADMLGELATKLQLRISRCDELISRIPVGHNLLDFSVSETSFAQQTERLLRLLGDRDFSEQDVIIYGSVGSQDISAISELDLIQMDRAVRNFVEIHANNVAHFHRKGCKRLILVHVEPYQEDMRDIINVMLEGRNGLFSRLPKDMETTLISIRDITADILTAAAVLAPAEV